MAAPSMTSLLEGLVAYWKTDEDSGSGHTLMDASGNGLHFVTEGSELDTANNTNWGEKSAVTITDGKNAGGVSPRVLYKLSESALQLGGGPFTLSFWFRIPAASWDQFVPLIGKGNYSAGVNEFIVEWLGAAGHVMQVRVDDNSHILDSDFCMVAMEPDTWYLCQVWRDTDANILGISINNAGAVPAVCEDNAVNTSSTNALPLWLGPPPNYGVHYPELDEIGIWSRVLTTEERAFLYNAGEGNFFDSFAEEEDVELVLACASTACCPPALWDNASECSSADASVGSPIFEMCKTSAEVLFDPPSGTLVVYPIFVRIYSEHPLASIRYTTDGSIPTDSSTLYTEPVEVTDAGVVIKARTYVAGCPDGDSTSGIWPPYTDDNLIFCFKGLSAEDNAGQWGEFAGNGEVDLKWWLEIESISDSGIRITEEDGPRETEEGDARETEEDLSDFDVVRFELYQLDEDFKWTTGQAWSTDEYVIPPFPEWDQAELFHVFPLVFFDQSPAQVNSAYTSNWGNIPVGTNQWNLYGEPIIPPSGFFMLIIYLLDGREIRLITDQDTCNDPPPCPALEHPTLTPLCRRIDLALTIPGAAKPYEVYAAPCTNPDTFTLITSGTSSGAIAYNYTGLSANCEYCFYWRVNWAGDATYGHCGWVASATVCATTSCVQELSLVVEPAIVCLGDSFDLDYSTLCAGSTVTISLITGNAANLNVAFPQALTPNTEGTITVTPTALGAWVFSLNASAIQVGCPVVSTEATASVVGTPEHAGSGCASMQSIVRITAYRQGNAAAPFLSMNTDVLSFIAGDIPFGCTAWYGPSGGCFTPGTPLQSIGAVWQFAFGNSDKPNFCHWSMLGGQPVTDSNGNAVGGIRLAKNKPTPDGYFYFYGNLDPNSDGVTQLRPDFTDKWVLEIVAKMMCGAAWTECYDSNGIVLWRGIKDCAGGPIGEYISDAHQAAPDALVDTRPENSHIYSFRIS